jgi:acyl carrier protein
MYVHKIKEPGKEAMEEVINSLRRLIAVNLVNGIRPEEINPDAELMDGGLKLDSLSIVKLIALSEREFGIEFGEEDLMMESFASLRALAGVIAAQRRLRNSRAPDDVCVAEIG